MIFFHHNNLFYGSQYGFLKDYSPEYAAMELADKVRKDIDDKKFCLPYSWTWVKPSIP